jgi:hypothetical protein
MITALRTTDLLFKKLIRERCWVPKSKLKLDVYSKADTLKQLRPIGKGDQELEKRLDQKELT